MFENPKIFYLFLALPLIIFFMIMDVMIFKKRVKKIAGKNTEAVIPFHSEGQKWLKIIFYTIAIILSIIGLARPRWGIESIDSKIKGKDIYILLDVSNSMSVKDVIPSRLELAKLNLQTLFELETGDRYGLVIFSDQPTIMSPLTNDYAAISFFLDSLIPGMIDRGGTNIPNAIFETANLLENELTAERIILLITDGENIQGDIKNIIQKVKDQDIKIFTAGVGTEEGKLIPVKNQNDEIIDYIKDDSGKPVRSRLDENQLKYIANETGAVYFGALNRKNFIKDSFNNLKNLKTIEHGKISYKQKIDRYDLFLIPALILFCLGFILDQGKIIKFHEKSFAWIFDKKNLIFLITFSFLLLDNNPVFSRADNTADIQENNIFKNPNGGFWGNLSFKKGNYRKALQQYKSAVNSLKDDLLSRLYYNIGNTYCFLNDNKNALNSYENAAALAKKDKLLAKIFYNQGLCSFKEKNYAAAAELFKKSLNYDDQDDDTRYNYVISSLLRDESQKSQNEQKKEQKEEEKNNENKQNEQNKTNFDEKNLSKKDIENILKALEEKEKKESKRDENKNSRTKSW